MDLQDATENLEEFKKKLDNEDIKIVPISAYTKGNLDELLYTVADILDTVDTNAFVETIADEVVEYVYEGEEAPFTIEKEDDGVYNVKGPMVLKFFQVTDFEKEETVKLFARRIRNLGVDDELRKLGVKHGDTVRILGYEFEFLD